MPTWTKSNLKRLFEQISPVIINPRHMTIGLSKRFLLFQILNQVTKKIEDDPYLNFVSIIKHYKVFTKFINGTIYELHRDRNKSYFRNFFTHKQIYQDVKQDIEWVFKINKDIKLTISKEGVIVYDNYKKNEFNILLLTIHAGTFVPPRVEEKMVQTKDHRFQEEDVDTHKMYSKIVLKQGGIWVDNKRSRFYCDINRDLSNCIYGVKDDKWSDRFWTEPLTPSQEAQIVDFYNNFYVILARILETYKFNIIFDAHSMRDEPGRADISLGTHYIPKFYLPIVSSIKHNIKMLGYDRVGINEPYEGGYILEWLSSQFPSLFIFSMEVNKKLYMSNHKTKKSKLKKISKELTNIFDIIEEEGYRVAKASPMYPLS